jgi:competence protein ComEC
MGLLLLWLSVGMLRTAAGSAHPDSALRGRLPEDPQAVRLHGVVVTDPVGLFEPAEAPASAFVLRLQHVRTTDGWRPVAGRVRVRVHQPRAPVEYGDELLVEGEWSRVPAPGNPGQYDWKAALARKRIHGLLRVRPFDGLVVLRSGQGNPVLAAVFRLRQRWDALIRAHFNARDAGLLLGLLLGQRAEIDEILTDAFIETGTVQSLATQCTKLP